jgi:hypothetical protein
MYLTNRGFVLTLVVAINLLLIITAYPAYIPKSVNFGLNNGAISQDQVKSKGYMINDNKAYSLKAAHGNQKLRTEHISQNDPFLNDDENNTVDNGGENNTFSDASLDTASENNSRSENEPTDVVSGSMNDPESLSGGADGENDNEFSITVYDNNESGDAGNGGEAGEGDEATKEDEAGKDGGAGVEEEDGEDGENGEEGEKGEEGEEEEEGEEGEESEYGEEGDGGGEEGEYNDGDD